MNFKRAKYGLFASVFGMLAVKVQSYEIVQNLRKKWTLMLSILESQNQWRIYIVKFWTPPDPNSFNFMQF